MKKKRILFVGENPSLQYGNSHMLRALLDKLDYEEFEPICFCRGDDPPIYTPQTKYRIINAMDGGDVWGKNKLLHLLNNTRNIDILFMVGIDTWRYWEIYQKIQEIQNRDKFIWVWLFPYDLQNIRKDWVNKIKCFDVPLVYSEYGFNLLKERVENIQYFRPPMDSRGSYRPYTVAEKAKVRSTYYGTVHKDAFVFGFIGPNQFRKEPQTLLKAFRIVKDRHPEAVLYLHTDIQKGEFNLVGYMTDCGFKQGDIYARPGIFSEEIMPDIYNCFDCYVNCSMQEGLSWTVLNAMACGVPVIVSDSTAHKELIDLDGVRAGALVPCEETRYLPLLTDSGSSWLDAKGCNHKDIAEAMCSMIENKDERILYSKRGIEKVQQWLAGVSDVNLILRDAMKKHPAETRKAKSAKINKVLFAQHSSAGDVLMTTRCFKGIKERHPGLDLVYMTSEQYINIVSDNPYVSEVIPWDVNALQEYEFVYNPHGEKILPGHWGRNSNSILSDFYWKILDVEPDDFFINLKEPARFHWSLNASFAGRFVIVHTTGGDPAFRTYKYMQDVCKWLKSNQHFTVQLGGKGDYPAGADMDLRGEFTFQETAWVMNQAVLAITVDSFMSHLAGALGISQICLFGSGNANVVRPNQMKGKLICMTPDYIQRCPGLGPCSASVRDCPTPCTGLHDPENIIANIKELESEKMIRRNYEHETSCCSIKSL